MIVRFLVFFFYHRRIIFVDVPSSSEGHTAVSCAAFYQRLPQSGTAVSLVVLVEDSGLIPVHDTVLASALICYGCLSFVLVD